MTYAAYQLTADFYEKTDRNEEAMEYHKILREYEMALLEELPKDELEKMESIAKHVISNPLKNTVNTISQKILDSKIEEKDKKVYLERLSKFDLHFLKTAYKVSKAKITDIDMKYIICFVAGIDTKDIGLIFNIEQASVRTVRYRIRKKFAKEETFRAIL